MKYITLTALKKYLATQSEQQLTDEITGLFKQFPAVKDYYTSKLSSQGSAEVLEKYKALVQHEFFPSRGFGKLRLSAARKAIRDFSKVATSAHDVIDIMLFYVEQGVLFTNEYGDIDEPFYNSMENMYESALALIAKHNLYDDYRARCQSVVAKAPEGWGFHDGLSERYHQGYDTYEG